MNSRVAALAVLSVVLAVVLGFEAGLRAGPLAGVLGALAGFVPAVVWELARDRRERTAQVAEKRAAALKVFESAGPRSGDGVAEDRVAMRGAAWLLRPEAEVVGFRSRPELGELVAWCAAGERLGVRLVTGDGGSGKTRLALQLETEVAGDGWRTLWVERGREDAAVAAVRDSGEPAVLVVDYAETRPGLAGLLAEAVAAGDCPDVRVVLLARSAGEWWQQLLAGADYRLSVVLEQAAALHLGPLTGADGRQELFGEAVTAFAGRLGVVRPDVRLLLDDPGAVVLVVHAAALLGGAGPCRCGRWRCCPRVLSRRGTDSPAGARGTVLAEERGGPGAGAGYRGAATGGRGGVPGRGGQ
jgi:hypothetical protein